jgi:PAS domain S-box-containing protein
MQAFMSLSISQLQALRECCRDDAAFARMQQILASSPKEAVTPVHEGSPSRVHYGDHAVLNLETLMAIASPPHDAELRYRAILDASPDMMFRLTRDGQYLDFEGKSSLIDIRREELVGRYLQDELPPDVVELSLKTIHKTLETGQSQLCEYQLDTVIGRRDYEARLVVSGVDEVLAIVRDVTDQKNAERALRLSEEKFATAFRSCPDAILITKLADGMIFDANDSFLQITGYTLDEVIGHTTIELGVWSDAGDRALLVQNLKAHGRVRHQELQFRIKSGELRYGSISAEVIEVGNETYVLSVTIDITEQRQAELRLRASAERDRILREITIRIHQSLDLKQILDTAVTEVRQFLKADRVFITHHDETGQGVIVAESVVPPWISIFGDTVYDVNEVKEELASLFTERQVRVIPDTSVVTEPSQLVECYIEHQVLAELVVPLWLDDVSVGLMVVNESSAPRDWQPMDVELLERLGTVVAIATQQARLYQKLQALNEDLENQVEERTAQLRQQMDTLEELGRLKDDCLNAFSHDLRTPMMGMGLVLNNLLSQPDHSLVISRSIVERMQQSVDRQLALIRSLLEAYSSETQGIVLQCQPLDLGEFLETIASHLEPLIHQQKSTLSRQLPASLPHVHADPVQLQRVFENLLTNALHHNAPGICLCLDAVVESDTVKISVQDNGVGIAPDVGDRLFERYTRGATAKRSTGVGLGLYLCRQIVNAHGGQIGVESSPGQGATFWITLPLPIQPHSTPER